MPVPGAAKVQVSACLEVRATTGLDRLLAYDEARYLHQTVAELPNGVRLRALDKQLHRRCGRIWSPALKTIADPPERDRWARLRFSIIGPLLAAPPDSGELQTALGLLAAKTWRHPTSGLDVSFGLSTLERWYYAARRSG